MFQVIIRHHNMWYKLKINKAWTFYISPRFLIYQATVRRG